MALAGLLMAAAVLPARADDPFKNPNAPWITTGRGIACASAEQLSAAQAAVASGNMAEFQTISAGCIAPEAGFEVRMVAPGDRGPSQFILVMGAEATGPWFSMPAFLTRKSGPP